MSKLDIAIKIIPVLKPVIQHAEQKTMQVASEVTEHFFSQARRLFSKTTQRPAAFKILNGDRSPFDETTIWSLPTQRASHLIQIPGNWKQFTGSFKSMNPSTLNDSRPGFYVTDQPRRWMFAAPKPRVFEVEIGDELSLNQWSLKSDDDFPVLKLRLLRQLNSEELKILNGFELTE